MRGVLLLAVAGCSIGESGLLAPDADNTPDVAVTDAHVGIDAPTTDAALDVTVDVPPDVPPPPDCNASTQPFGSFEEVTSIDTGSDDYPALSSDELTIYFTRFTGTPSASVLYAQRASTSMPFGTPSPLSSIGTNTFDLHAWVVDPFATLYFAAIENTMGWRIYSATGDGKSPDNWSGAALVTSVSSATGGNNDWFPAWSTSTSELFFSSDRMGAGGGFNVWISKGGSAPTAVAPVNSGMDEVAPTPSSDGLSLYFARGNAMTLTLATYVSRRTSATAAFGAPVAVAELNAMGGFNVPGWLSNDGCRMYFSSDRGMSFNIWMATRTP